MGWLVTRERRGGHHWGPVNLLRAFLLLPETSWEVLLECNCAGFLGPPYQSITLQGLQWQELPDFLKTLGPGRPRPGGSRSTFSL